MPNRPSHDALNSRHAVISAALVVLCFAAGFAAVTGLYAWSALCEEGTFDRCSNGHPSFEVVFQAVLAVAGFLAMLAARAFLKRRSNALAGLALLVALLLFAGWAVFLDAATHGWDDLKLLWLGIWVSARTPAYPAETRVGEAPATERASRGSGRRRLGR
jgi:hypothetical protein